MSIANPPQSCRRHRRDGPVRRTDNLISSALRLVDCGAGRRQILWFGVTAHPTAEWIANQITEACGWEQSPRYPIRDRKGPTVRPSSEGFDQWAFAIDRRRRVPHGKTDMLKG
jgi:hypothetical protein